MTEKHEVKAEVKGPAVQAAGERKQVDPRVVELVVALVPGEAGKAMPTEEQRKVAEELQALVEKAQKAAEAKASGGH